MKDAGKYIISTRWVITEKYDVAKVRLVTRGFEELSCTQCDASTAAKACLWMTF